MNNFLRQGWQEYRQDTSIPNSERVGYEQWLEMQLMESFQNRSVWIVLTQYAVALDIRVDVHAGKTQKEAMYNAARHWRLYRAKMEKFNGYDDVDWGIVSSLEDLEDPADALQELSKIETFEWSVHEREI